MLNPALHPDVDATQPVARIHPDLANHDWCVGDAPARWDVSFGDRIWLMVRRWFARGDDAPARSINSPDVFVAADALRAQREAA